MTKSDTPKEKLEKQIEHLLERVRQMKPGGDLDALLNEEIADLSRLARSEAAKERSRTQGGPSAAFPPSRSMSQVRQPSDARRGKKKSSDS